MKLKIGTKLIGSFLPIVLLMAAMAFYSASLSQSSLKEAVGRSSIVLAEDMLKRIDQDIYLKLEVLQIRSKGIALQSIVLKSNEEFEKLASIENFVARKDREWTAAAEEEVTSHMNALLSNELSNNLSEELIHFYEEKYGYSVFSDIFVTNKYGANVTQTGKTSDYRQDDKEWWQIARERGLYIGDFEFDKSAGKNGIAVGVRIDDSEDSFMGVIRAFLSAEDIIRDAEIAINRYETTSIKLITEYGKLFYSTKAFGFLEDVSENIFFKNVKGESGFFIAEEGGSEKLFSFAHSKGYRDFSGHRWILVMGHDIDEVLKPAFTLRTRIVIFSLVLIVVGIFIAYFISRSIAKPIIAVRNAAIVIAQGNLEKRVEVISKDEIGELADSFNQMTGKLKKSYTGLEEKVQERTVELEKANEQLKHGIIERKRAAEALKESEEKYRSLFESNQDGIRFSDMEGNFVDANQAYLNMLGYPMEEYRKLGHPQLTPKKWQKQDEEIVKNQVLPRGYSDVFEKEFIRKDGTIISVSVRAFLIQDKKGNPTGMWEIIRDITERKQAEVELKKHRERLEELVQERTAELQKTINLMAGRELRMAELKETIKKLRSQLEASGLIPVSDDPLKQINRKRYD